jgi:translocation and assembly module TamA
MPDIGIEWPDMGVAPEEEAAVAPGPGPISGPDPGPGPGPGPGIDDAASERGYSVRLEGLEEVGARNLLADFNALSTLEAGKSAFANIAQIDRRARADADLLAELLRSRGYYDAAVETRVEVNSATGKIEIIFTAQPGPLYHFAEVQLPGLETAGADEQPLREAFGVGPGKPVEAAAVIAGVTALQAELGKRGYAFASLGAMDIAIDHETRSAVLTLAVTPQGTRRFGRIVVENDKVFGASHVMEIARFKEGQPYQAPAVEDLRRALIATGLVSSVTIQPVARPDSDIVDLAVALEPAPMRTIAGEAGYGTGEGFRVEASWQHRNLIGPEGAVTFRAILGTREKLVAADLRRSNFGKRDQTLTALATAGHTKRDAYEADTIQLGAGIERKSNFIWQKKWTWSAGGELIASDEKDVDIASSMTRKRTFFIGALPGSLSYDGSNDLLDPTKGFRLSARLSPEVSLQNGVFGYAKAQIDGSFYQPLSDKVVIAGRARLGSIVGESRDRIAPSRRFYAGGGGSVRGYGFQHLGPRDPVFDDPIGGRSLAEFSIEARVRTGLFGGALGIVPFIDAGNIYTSSLPKLDQLRFGVGVGLRYHTSFGPIRVDVGTPIKRRPGEARIAVYVSLGQAF